MWTTPKEGEGAPKEDTFGAGGNVTTYPTELVSHRVYSIMDYRISEKFLGLFHRIFRIPLHSSDQMSRDQISAAVICKLRLYKWGDGHSCWERLVHEVWRLQFRSKPRHMWDLYLVIFYLLIIISYCLLSLIMCNHI